MRPRHTTRLTLWAIPFAILLGSAGAYPRPCSAQAPAPVATTDSLAESQRGQRQQPGGGLVFKDHVTPNWFADNTRFWYRNDLAGGAREFILVDAARGVR